MPVRDKEKTHNVGALPAGTRFWGSSGRVVYMVLDLAMLPGSHRAGDQETWAVVLSSPGDTGAEYRPGMVRSFRNSLPVALVEEEDKGEGSTVLVVNRGKKSPPPNPVQDPPGGEG